MLTRQRIEAAATQLSGCGCQLRLASISNAGRFGAYQRIVGVRHALSGPGNERVPALLPISDKTAVANAIRIFAARRGITALSGFGDGKQVQGAASYATTGASVGTAIFPGIGTVIGAVVGAVAGWIMGKSKPVRPSAAEMAQCTTLTSEYLSFAAQSPNVALPMEIEQIKNLFWCMGAIHGGMVKLKDPRYFLSGFDENVAIFKRTARAIFETPIGAQVPVPGLEFRDAKGKMIRLPGSTFTNTQFVGIRDFVERVIIPAQVKNCEPWGKAACAAYFQIPLVKRVYFDLFAYAARMELPNISEDDLKAASQVAATIPNTSARDVVSAVESILQRSVIRDETAALLTTASVTPPPSTAPPNTPVTINVPGAGGSAPIVNLPPTIAPISPAVEPPPVSSSPSTLTPEPPNPFLNLPTMNSGGGSSYLPSPQGQKSPGALQPMTAGIGESSALWIAGGLAIVGVLFATARPAAARRTVRS